MTVIFFSECTTVAILMPSDAGFLSVILKFLKLCVYKICLLDNFLAVYEANIFFWVYNSFMLSDK